MQKHAMGQHVGARLASILLRVPPEPAILLAPDLSVAEALGSGAWRFAERLGVGAIELRIGAAEEVRSWAYSWATVIVSCVNVPEMAAPEGFAGARRHVLVFRDLTDVLRDESITEDQAQELVEVGLAMRAEDARLLVHCRAGVGRSPAAALVVLCAAGLDGEAALSRVRSARPQARPNALVVLRGSMALRSRGLPDPWSSYLRWAASEDTWWRLGSYTELRGLSDADLLRLMRGQTHRRRTPRPKDRTPTSRES